MDTFMLNLKTPYLHENYSEIHIMWRQRGQHKGVHGFYFQLTR